MKSPLQRCLRSALALGLAGAALLVPSASAQGRPDTVYRLNDRTGKVLAITGTVLENSLTKVRVDRSGKESSYDASEIVQIDWGSVPPSYRDGMTYRRKGEYAEAVDAFRVAATDASTREVVQADARLKAAETLLMLGASDSGQFQEAASEADKLVGDFPDSSLVPRARYVAGRALRLSGQDAAAAAALESLYNEGSTEPATAGYTRRACLEAGLEAAWCYLAAGETLKARELFGGAKGGLEMLVGSMGEADAASRQAVEAAAGEAAQGEGFCMLAGGQTDQALSFFERTTGRADSPAGARFAALLGRGEALAAKGRHRDAQLCFAEVASLEHSSRDRAARALLGLAQSSLALGDGDAAGAARQWLKVVTESYGDTPAARQASEMQGNL